MGRRTAKEPESLADLARKFAAECREKAVASELIVGASATWKKQVVSIGAAVVPKRIKDAEKLCAQHGVPTDFTTHRGQPIFESRAHRKKVLKIFNMRDNSGGYGD